MAGRSPWAGGIAHRERRPGGGWQQGWLSYRDHRRRWQRGAIRCGQHGRCGKMAGRAQRAVVLLPGRMARRACAGSGTLGAIGVADELATEQRRGLSLGRKPALGRDQRTCCPLRQQHQHDDQHTRQVERGAQGLGCNWHRWCANSPSACAAGPSDKPVAWRRSGHRTTVRLAQQDHARTLDPCRIPEVMNDTLADSFPTFGETVQVFTPASGPRAVWRAR